MERGKKHESSPFYANCEKGGKMKGYKGVHASYLWCGDLYNISDGFKGYDATYNHLPIPQGMTILDFLRTKHPKESWLLLQENNDGEFLYVFHRRLSTFRGSAPKVIEK